MYTLEKAPEGPILLEVADVSSRSLRARWTPPPRPHGNLSYALHYKSKGRAERSPSHSRTRMGTLYTCML